MIKAGQKKKKNNTETVRVFFCEPNTVKVVELLLTLTDDELRSFFAAFYEALQAIGSETTFAAIGIGDPEKVIQQAGTTAPLPIRQLGARIEGMVNDVG